MNTIKTNKANTLLIAHRGLSGIEQENTNAAFIAAGNRSYFGIETDVHVTVDGKFVTIHDDTTKRVAIDDLTIEDSTFDTLRGLTLLSKDGIKNRNDMKIPTLTEYISTCKRYEKTAVLELKNEFTQEDIAKICDEINELEYLENVIFISFCFENLVRIRNIYPGQTVQFLTDEYSDGLVERLVEHKFDLDILYTQLNEENIALLHSKNIKVNCWTCDDKEYAEKLCSYGIDFITSNILE